MLTQGFFAYRVRKVTGNSLAAALVCVLSVVQFVATIITGVLAFAIPNFLDFLHDARVKILVIVWLVSSVACDTIITSTLVLYLRRQKIGFADSDRFIDQIVRLTLCVLSTSFREAIQLVPRQTGLTSTIVVSLDLVLYLSYVRHASVTY